MKLSDIGTFVHYDLFNKSGGGESGMGCLAYNPTPL